MWSRIVVNTPERFRRSEDVLHPEVFATTVRRLRSALLRSGALE